MCYNAVSATRAKLKYAIHRGDEDEIQELEKKLERLMEIMPPQYHVSGFSHPRLLVFTNDEPKEPQAYQWGLIPGWVKDLKTGKTLSNQTLNARSESMFEKPSFRSSAKSKRCMIYLDAFYEFHHHNGNKIPFHIAMKDKSPLAIGGLWEQWTDKETGEILRTVSIVTCEGNPLMAKIHNNPDKEGPRMPVILPKEKQDEWLLSTAKEDVLNLAKPFPEELLDYYTVGKLLGKEAIGNIPEVEQKVEYPEIVI